MQCTPNTGEKLTEGKKMEKISFRSSTKNARRKQTVKRTKIIEKNRRRNYRLFRKHSEPVYNKGFRIRDLQNPEARKAFCRELPGVLDAEFKSLPPGIANRRKIDAVKQLIEILKKDPAAEIRNEARQILTQLVSGRSKKPFLKQNPKIAEIIKRSLM